MLVVSDRGDCLTIGLELRMSSTELGLATDNIISTVNKIVPLE